MTIDRIGSIDPIQPGKKPGGVSQANKTARTDSISISKEAMEKSELYRVMDMVAATPDIRAERVAELKQKINDPSYLNDQVINATAERIIDALWG
jgi:negative regulator of flagellin synthesis FlgM